ncbi:hypothetical protein SAMN05421779_102313 [Insolitispirillum peregrinum]|uniref:Uncharacterized protein n=1 Tax=Insolitispirillum peregrinum TaxID=80876 RepID=A0A1N7JIV8_9PROT|nr:hypothetical protein SAMN05421779_102313 [Insolitispirillum peregrinum]
MDSRIGDSTGPGFAMSIFKLTVDGQRLGKCGTKREERFRSV